MARTMTKRERVEARVKAAWINGGPKAATPRGNGRYTVVGRAGDRYTVVARPWRYASCDCLAGRNGSPCWHLMAVLLRIVADRMVEQRAAA